MRAFSQGNKGQPVSIVITEAELTDAAKGGAASANTGAAVGDVKVTIDAGGLHVTGSAATGPLSVSVRGDVVAGPVNDRLVLRLRTLSADPLPPAVVDGLRAGIEKALADATVDVPFLVRRVTFRQGCLGVSGVTPP
jgi:hypothetical protein